MFFTKADVVIDGQLFMALNVASRFKYVLLVETKVWCLGVVEVNRDVHRVHADFRRKDPSFFHQAEARQMLAHAAGDLFKFDPRKLYFLFAHHAIQGLCPLGYIAHCKDADAVKLGYTELAVHLAQQMFIQFFFQTAHGPDLSRG